MKPIPTSLEHRILLPEDRSVSLHPTLILLHGRGADEEDLLGLAPRLDNRLLLLSVRAPFPFAPGGGYTWYDLDGIGTPEERTFRESMDRVNMFVDDIRAHYPVDPHQLSLLGFSMGAVMSFAVSLTRPEFFRFVSANSGYVPERTHLDLRWRDLAHLSIHIAHGTADPVIPLAFARRAQELFKQSNARWTYREYDMPHTISEESLADIIAWMRPLLPT